MKIIPEKGERMLIVGQTGSGKTLFACHLLDHCEQTPIFIYDTKIEPKFDEYFPEALQYSRWQDMAKRARERMEGEDIFIWRPEVSIVSDPEILDYYLSKHYLSLTNSICYLDEIYQYHQGVRAGPGLVSLLTRGRSKGITTIMSTQRPAWLSRFALTEAQKFCVFRLIDKADKKRLADVIPNFDTVKNAAKYHFYFYDTAIEQPIYFSPIEPKKPIENPEPIQEMPTGSILTWL